VLHQVEIFGEQGLRRRFDTFMAQWQVSQVL
jgi:hypothetical protein